MHFSIKACTFSGFCISPAVATPGSSVLRRAAKIPNEVTRQCVWIHDRAQLVRSPRSVRPSRVRIVTVLANCNTGDAIATAVGSRRPCTLSRLHDYNRLTCVLQGNIWQSRVCLQSILSDCLYQFKEHRACPGYETQTSTPKQTTILQASDRLF